MPEEPKELPPMPSYWWKDDPPPRTTQSCPVCHTFEEPYFSRVEPMGYFCPICGTEA
jgi:transposase